MKFSVKRDEFLHGINIASRAVSLNNTLPILSNILLRTEGKKLYFEATNLEIAIKYFLETEIMNEGKITIPARLFQSYVSLLEDKELSVNISDSQTINILSSNSKTQIKGLSAEDFPQIPSVERRFELSIPAKELSESIPRVIFAASSNSARPVLSGILLHGEGAQLKFAATDSYRLSEKIITLDNPLDEELQVIVPAKSMLELHRLIGEDLSKNIVLIISNNQILFKIGNIELTSRLISGQFPNYKQVIPAGAKSKVIIDKSELSQNIKRVSLFAKENNNNIKLGLFPDNQKFVITTDATQIGTEEAQLNAKIEGDENKIALNSEYFLDLLNTLPSGEITISVDNKLAPALITHKDVKDFLHIIMPLKL